MSESLQVKLSHFEKKWICSWANDSIYDSGHWGNGVAFLPEEDSLIQKLKSVESDIVLYKNEIHMLFTWLEARIGNGVAIIGEDMVVGRRILELYKKIFDNKSSEFLRLKKIIGE